MESSLMANYRKLPNIKQHENRNKQNVWRSLEFVYPIPGLLLCNVVAMRYSEIKEIVEKSIHDSSNYNFLVTYADGTREKKRMFISRDGYVCEFKKRSRTRGRCIGLEELWRTVEPVKADTDKVTICKRNTKNIIKYLTASGLWPDILDNMIKLQQLKDEDLEYLCKCEYDEHNKFMQEKAIEHISPDMYLSLISKRGIITVNWSKNSWYKQGWLDAYKNKRNYSMKWTANYDNSIEYKPDDKRAWYSEEYLRCGNGHYYLLLDEKHAAFREDD